MAKLTLWSDRGIRRTPFREQVFVLLCAKGFPMTHAEILQNLSGRPDRVTLYRTLECLKNADLLHQVQGADGVWRYCAHDPDDPGCPGNHPHFMCLKCGRMICLLGQALPHIDVPEDVCVEGKQLVVYGLCSDCGEKKSTQ